MNDPIELAGDSKSFRKSRDGLRLLPVAQRVEAMTYARLSDAIRIGKVMALLGRILGMHSRRMTDIAKQLSNSALRLALAIIHELRCAGMGIALALSALRQSLCCIWEFRRDTGARKAIKRHQGASASSLFDDIR